jgi:hypothetical protein
VAFQRVLLPGCALLVVLAFVTLTRADPDLWGHVRFGGDIIDSGTIRVPETYSFTSDRPWINHEWLSEVLMAGAYRTAGSAGLVLLKLGVIAASLGAIWVIVSGDGARGRTAIVITALALCGILPRVQQVRPQLFSVLCFSLLVLLLRRAERRPELLWLGPPLLAFWANTHGGWLVGCGTLGLWCAARSWNILRTPAAAPGQRSRSLALIWTACAAGIAATLLNPYGAGLWRFLAGTVGPSRRFIDEWGMVTSNPTTLGVWTLFALISIVALRRANLGERLPAVVVAVFWGVAAFKVSRLDAFFALSVAGLLAPELARAIESRRRDTTPSRRPSLAAQTAAGVLAAAALAATVPTLRHNLTCIDIHAASTLPEAEAMAFVRDRGLEGRMVTYFDWGQYAIWHKPDAMRVSMDGRRETIYTARSVDLHLDMYLALSDGLAYFESLRADYVWVPRELPLAKTLAASPDWVPVYRSDRSIILARSGVAEAALPIRDGAPAQCRCFPGP